MSCLVFLTVSACASTETASASPEATASTSVKVTTSTVPLLYTNNERTEFSILGEVLYESKEPAGYIGLLRAARDLYPETDYVIDIMAEQRTITTETTTETTTASSSRRSSTVKTETEVIWVMRGTAVKYKR